MQQTEKYWNLINRIVFVAIVLMALVGGMMAFLPKVRQMQKYQDRRDELQQRIEIKLAEEKDLKDRQQRFLTDPAYIERVAHEVGYARKDETIYHFPKENDSL